jgi:undecaprenyl phosphate-alpha-L-ara4FN deformylase
VLEVKEAFAFRYNSDCRGNTLFRPVLDRQRLGTVQIPTTLPTFDEIVGAEVSEADYNEYMIKKMRDCQAAPVYTIHAEVEGLSRAALFEDLLKRAAAEELLFCPLSMLLPADIGVLPPGRVACLPFPGREGCLGRQIDAEQSCLPR